MYYVYVLRSLKDGRRYIGSTGNLEERLIKHNSGSVIATKNRRPFVLIYSECYETKKEAFNREMFYKTGKGREYLDSIER